VAAAERVRQELGGADVLINNAGVMLTAPFTSDKRSEHRQMVETNLLGAMTSTEVFLDQLRAKGGDLVNISSVAGRVAPAGFAAYSATKWGINGWSEALRVELQPDIRVMVVEPGAVATELSDHITDDESKRVAREYRDSVAMPPQDIAEVIAFAMGRRKRISSMTSWSGRRSRRCERGRMDVRAQISIRRNHYNVGALIRRERS
jgi:NADP-dependent 3-hydroxy acid dehydrogenase YdfG